ncbi:Reticulocyte-binding protein 2-like protein a [Frankliniella fusca]|uniref:Reticulocyte-binding protein 2-like protein a n=1 Tax=Frankliniella fusca TaxID=407009 RepID=A0AAE1HN75_9NEOP|nr:Reticulocyte-binding protein 2-like protein a [Frankliniella fusca]
MGPTSTPMRSRDVYCFETSSVSPINGAGWRPTVAPRRAAAALPMFNLQRHRALLADGHAKYQPAPPPEGRRCILYQQFIEQILADKHPGGYCSFMNCVFVGETLLGFRSIMYYQCEMCHKITKLETDGPNREMNINMSMVNGTVEGGITYAAVRTLAAAINMPAPTKKTYAHYEDKLADIMEAAAMDEMLEVGKRAKAHAIAVGNVKDGIPWVTCILDGQWSKRVYKCKYDATSGSVTVIEEHTGKVIWQATKNKRCSVCEYAARKSIPVRPHKCGKNYKGPSTGMEAALAVEAFRSSMEMHGVMILKYIGDGDSSVGARLQAASPYGAKYVIQKVECKNHVLRNFKRALIDISTSALPCPEGVTQLEMKTLKKAVRENVLRMSTGVSKACEYRGETEKDLGHHERVRNLRKDIMNTACHVFGEHSTCALYFCKTRQAAEAAAATPAGAPAGHGDAPPTCAPTQELEENLVKRLQRSGLWPKIMVPLNRVADLASSLVYNVTNNPCEVANSVIAQRASNKRPYLGGRRSYQTRVYSAGLSLNTSAQGLRVVHRSIANSSPGKYTEKYVQARKAERNEKRLRLAKRKLDLIRGAVRPAPRPAATGPDEHYGLQEEGNQPPPADDPVRLQEEADKFLQSLLDNLQAEQEELKDVEQGSIEWRTARKNRLTAVDFGEVCKRRPDTSCRRFVFDKLYRAKTDYAGQKPDPKQIQHGKTYEPAAKARLATKGYKIQNCSFFIDTEMPYLGASPDGLLDNSAVLEIKCPFTAYESKSKDEAMQSGQIKYLRRDEDGNIKLRKDDNYYYQVQGQLHITKRDRCVFVVYAKEWEHIEEIERDDEFWNNEMRDKLERFYKEALLPEIVMPLYQYRLEKKDIREARSVIEELARREKDREEKAQRAAEREGEKRKKKEEKDAERKRKEEAAERRREVAERKREEAAEKKRQAAEKKERQAEKRRGDGENGSVQQHKRGRR